MTTTVIPQEILNTYFPKTGDLPTEHGDGDKNNETLFRQIRHRVELVNFWSIPLGSKILEIGCGQGDTTLVLAAQVGDNGFVDAVDPGGPDYGAPQTLSQAQSQLKAGPLGHRITFHNAFPIPFLENLISSSSSSSSETNEIKPYTHIILSHSSFYFSSPSIFPDLIEYITSLSSPVRAPTSFPAKEPQINLITKQTQICLAEWDLHATSLTQLPHLLAVLLQAVQESYRKEGDEGAGNVRCIRSVQGMKDTMMEYSWKVLREKREEVERGLEDGSWEVGNVGKWKEGEMRRLRGGNEREEEVGGNGNGNGNVGGNLKEVEEKKISVMEMMYDVLDMSLENVEEGVKGVETMGVWAASFVREDCEEY